MKAVWAILLTVALLLSPAGWSDVTRGAAKPAPCRHCACGGAGCCVDQAPAVPPPPPAVPAPTAASAPDVALLLASFAVLTLPRWSAPEVPTPTQDSALLPAVPLQERHCCFLI